MKISPLAILFAYRAIFFAAVSDAADVVAGRSDPSTSITTSLIIKPTDADADVAADISGADDLKKSLNMASAVTVTRNFLSEDETALFRLNENKYQRMPAVGYSGNRTWGGAYLPRSFLHKLVEVGGQQCASEDYKKSLPAGVHILTNHVTETTDPHVDCNPTTFERIENDVAVVFLNSNPDATFYVEDEGYPVEEGMLITFPGGSVFHHIEMEKPHPHHIKMKKPHHIEMMKKKKESGKKKKDSGSVHMLGPVEVGGSHGLVGKRYKPEPPERGQQRFVSYINQNQRFWRMLEVFGSEHNSTTTSSTPQQYGTNITGYITVTGYRDGIDFNGVTNHTLEVAYRLEELGSLNCSAVNCVFSADIIKNQPNFCESAKIGQIMNSTNDDAAGSQTFLEITSLSLLDDIGQALDGVDLQSEIMTLFENFNIDIPDVIEGAVYINIGKPVTYFFDAPMALHRQDETMLACSVFTEVEAAAEEDTTSGASSSHIALWTLAVFVSSAVALIASL